MKTIQNPILRSIVALCAISVLGTSIYAQKEIRPWNEWSKKDAERILNDSSWGQTHTEGGTTTDTSVVTNTRGGMSGDRKGESGEPVKSRAMNFRVRFLTAKPVREAFARMVVLQQPNAGADLVTQLQGFVDRDFGDYLVLTFSAEGDDPRMVQGMMMGLGRLTAESLKGKVSLQRTDGTSATLIDYKPPTNDGMGAKFVFSRTLDGKPFLTNEVEHVKFVFDLSERQKFNMRFKVAGMTYAGKLEY